MEYSIALLIGIAAVFGVSVYWDRRHAEERARWAKERASLLDRVMARDWTEFRAFSGDKPVTPPAPQVIDDEQEAAYAEAHGL